MIFWSIGITSICFIILLIGKYKLLDKVINIIIITLTISTLLAVSMAFLNSGKSIDLLQVFPQGSGLLFVITFMGWMPAPMDISIWHSIWVLEKKESLKNKLSLEEGLFDFDVGYITTVFLGVPRSSQKTCVLKTVFFLISAPWGGHVGSMLEGFWKI